jgi:spermidine synthase
MPSLREIIDSFKVKSETVISKGNILQVVYNDKLVMLKLDGATNSRISKGSVYTGGYWDYFIPIVYAYRNPSVLMIGLGIGTTPYQLHKIFGKGLKLDIVEYDPNVVKLARKYAPGGIKDRIVVADGAEYVANTKKKYDIIILDAYGSGARIPRQFYDREFIRSARGALKADGTMAINYAMHPYGILKFIGYKIHLKEKFRVFSVKVNNASDNQIILCSRRLGKNELMWRMRKMAGVDTESRQLAGAYAKMRKL